MRWIPTSIRSGKQSFQVMDFRDCCRNTISLSSRNKFIRKQMNNDPYQQLKNIIESLALKINAPASLLPTYRISDDGALPHLVVDDAGIYHFIVVERGQELEHRKTSDRNELLYWVFAGITFSMACKYELKHRVKDQDFRKILFEHQEQLLASLSADWHKREVSAHAAIVERSPFDNDLS
ncbi:MAG: hypothetical protein EOO00_00060 [Chitinophagaceae bacterium]|nr:MAG: hypothetical protein EOO00_00060 [Chitinophagaceae bacterium]